MTGHTDLFITLVCYHYTSGVKAYLYARVLPRCPLRSQRRMGFPDVYLPVTFILLSVYMCFDRGFLKYALKKFHLAYMNRSGKEHS